MAPVAAALYTQDCVEGLAQAFPDEMEPVLQAIVNLSNPFAQKRRGDLRRLQQLTGINFTHDGHEDLMLLYSGQVDAYCTRAGQSRYDAIMQSLLFSLASIYPDHLVEEDVFRGNSLPSQVAAYGTRCGDSFEAIFAFVPEQDARELARETIELSFGRILSLLFQYCAIHEYSKVKRTDTKSMRMQNAMESMRKDLHRATKSIRCLRAVLEGKDIASDAPLPDCLLHAVATAGRLQGLWRRQPQKLTDRNNALLQVAQVLSVKAGHGAITPELTQQLSIMLDQAREGAGVYSFLVSSHIKEFVANCPKGKRVDIGYLKAFLGLRSNQRLLLRGNIKPLLMALGADSVKQQADIVNCIDLIMGDLRSVPAVADVLNIPAQLHGVMMLPARLRCARVDMLPTDVQTDMVAEFAPAINMLARSLPSIGKLTSKQLLCIASALTGNRAAVQQMLLDGLSHHRRDEVLGLLAFASAEQAHPVHQDRIPSAMRSLLTAATRKLPQDAHMARKNIDLMVDAFQELACMRALTLDQFVRKFRAQGQSASARTGSPLMVILHRMIGSKVSAGEARHDATIIALAGFCHRVPARRVFQQLATLRQSGFSPLALERGLERLCSVFGGNLENDFFQAVCGLASRDNNERLRALGTLLGCMFGQDQFAQALMAIAPDARRALRVVLSVLCDHHQRIDFEGDVSVLVPEEALSFFSTLVRCESPNDAMRLICTTLMPDAQWQNDMAVTLVGLNQATSKTIQAMEPLLEALGQGSQLNEYQRKAIKCLGTIVLYSSDWPHALKALGRMVEYESEQAKLVGTTLLDLVATCMKWRQAYGDPSVIDESIDNVLALVGQLSPSFNEAQRSKVAAVLRACVTLAISHRPQDVDDLSVIADLIHPRLSGSMLKAVLALQRKDFDNARELLSLLSVDASQLMDMNKIAHATRFRQKQTKSLQQALQVGQAARDRLRKINNKEDLVNNFDWDASGTLDWEEFKQLIQFYKAPNPVSEGMIYRLFVKYKLPKEDAVSTSRAFAALNDLDKDVQGRLLSIFKLSTGHVMAAIFSLLLVLTLFLVFIFTGIIAFTSASNFNSVINSLLTLSGVGGAGKVTDNISKLIDDDKLEQLIDRLDQGDLPSIEISESDLMNARAEDQDS
eukprot:TRINITY_DN12612_c0_g3_i2.p1 TRINITY_DN12612_c0_g3~~TRINITY_DN12612_c0_g3_i2.p1  ORF type:complete len:1305 (+),score=321.12 TRINITY_DN12612_c0_g3_i2:500-3916(+)